MTPATFPQPGERQNAASISVPEGVLTWLVSAADALYLLEACNDAECDTCRHKQAMLAYALGLLAPEQQEAVVEAALGVSDRLRREWFR